MGYWVSLKNEGIEGHPDYGRFDFFGERIMEGIIAIGRGRDSRYYFSSNSSKEVGVFLEDIAKYCPSFDFNVKPKKLENIPDNLRSNLEGVNCFLETLVNE